jgi:hypothetical protein
VEENYLGTEENHPAAKARLPSFVRRGI